MVIPFKSNSKSIKIPVGVIPDFSKVVYHGYFGRVIMSMGEDNFLVKVKNNKIIYANAEDLAKNVGVSINSFRKFLTEAKRLDIIIGTKTVNGYGYVINSEYAYINETNRGE